MQNFIPITNGNGQFLADGYFTPGPGVAQSEIRNDKKVAFSIQPVTANQPGSQILYARDFLSSDSLSLAIGNIDTPPSGGNFSLQVGATTSGLANLSATITGAALQTALNAALTTEGKPLCAVVEVADGTYTINAVSNGAITTGFFQVIASTLLYPTSSAFFVEGTLGSSTTPYQLLYVMRQQPMCYAEPATLLPTADVAIATTQAGDGTHNHIQVISFNVDQVYDGAYTINATANSVVTSCGNATPNMTAQQLGLLLATHPEINYQTPYEDDNIAVTQQGQTWTVEFIGSLKNSNANTLTVANSTQNPLVGPTGLSGFIYYNTIGLYEYSITQEGDSFTLTRQIQRTRADGEVSTLYLDTVTIYKDMIDAATAVPTPIASYYTAAQSDARFAKLALPNMFTGGEQIFSGTNYPDGLLTVSDLNRRATLGDIGGDHNQTYVDANDDDGSQSVTINALNGTNVTGGNLAIATAGKTVTIASGTNAKAGTFTLVAGVATVANTSVTANSVIAVTLKTLGGTRTGNPDIVPTATTGFVATGGIADTSTYNFVITEVA